MKSAIFLLAALSMWGSPASSRETWQCPNLGRYSIEGAHVFRAEPPLVYNVVADNKFAVVAVLTNTSADFVGVGIFILRKSDGALLRFGNGISGKFPNQTAVTASPSVIHCHKD
jgi:hypothetical protein